MTQLKIIKLGKKEYYFDEKLAQIRNVKNPNDFIDLIELEMFLLKKTVLT